MTSLLSVRKMNLRLSLRINPLPVRMAFGNLTSRPVDGWLIRGFGERDWEELGNSHFASCAGVVFGTEIGQRVTIQSLSGIRTLVLLVDRTTARYIGSVEIHADGRFQVKAEPLQPTDAPIPIADARHVLAELGIDHDMSINITDHAKSDEDILRYKRSIGKIYIPARYLQVAGMPDTDTAVKPEDEEDDSSEGEARGGN